jgi:non-ribosomal peptide synthetase component F
MKMAHADRSSLRDVLGDFKGVSGRYLCDAETSVDLRELVEPQPDAAIDGLRGRSVVIAIKDHLQAAIALIKLDGIARRLVLCPPDLPSEHLSHVNAVVAAEAVVTDSGTTRLGREASQPPENVEPSKPYRTEWILLTSGTTGVPKMVAHTVSSLAGALKQGGAHARGEPPVWSTFYDIRRYGGLQIFFRAILGGGSLVLSKPAESLLKQPATFSRGWQSRRSRTSRGPLPIGVARS